MTRIIINKNVELKCSFEWIKQSFFTFREHPLQFIFLGIFSGLIGLLPFLGSFMSPIFMAKFILMTDQAERGERIPMSSVFEGWFTNPTVVRLAFINFCLNAIIILGQYFFDYKSDAISKSLSPFLYTAVITISFIPVILLQVSMWLAPAICALDNTIHPRTAMWLSLKASFYNVPTLVLYSIMVLAFTLLAIIPFGLGLLVWIPMLNIIPYYVYHKLFVAQAVTA